MRRADRQDDVVQVRFDGGPSRFAHEKRETRDRQHAKDRRDDPDRAGLDQFAGAARPDLVSTRWKSNGPKPPGLLDHDALCRPRRPAGSESGARPRPGPNSCTSTSPKPKLFARS
jgi:hypothetical protein